VQQNNDDKTLRIKVQPIYSPTKKEKYTQNFFTGAEEVRYPYLKKHYLRRRWLWRFPVSAMVKM
jgi:hypothetical protein